MKEIIVIQIGQCGNQIGHRFWQLAIDEFCNCKTRVSDDMLSSFFRIRDEKSFTFGVDGEKKIPKCRALIVDTEERVVDRLMNSQLQNVFDHKMSIKDMSGAGNNWGAGYVEYGNMKLVELKENIRKLLEECSSFQSFFFIHSSSGGTGSGLGSRISEELYLEYPELLRFSSLVLPSTTTTVTSIPTPSSSSIQTPSLSQSDVVIAPYNSVMCLSSLLDSCDAILPFQNSALERVFRSALKLEGGKEKEGGDGKNAVNILNVGNAKPGDKKDKDRLPYEGMNDVAGRVLNDLTSSMRFGGSLNLDINEITTNFIPFPSTTFLLSALSPFVIDRSDQLRRTPSSSMSSSSASSSSSLNPFGSMGASRAGGGAGTGVGVVSQRINTTRLFDDVLSKEFCFNDVDLGGAHRYLSCGFFGRGETMTITDMHEKINRCKDKVSLPAWNVNGFKVGLCSQAPPGLTHSLMCISNNTCIRKPLSAILASFDAMFKRQTHIHHYKSFGIDADYMREAREMLCAVVDCYAKLERETAVAAGSSSMYEPVF